MAIFDMVFEGGGAKGSAFAGALEEFHKAGHKPARLIGTSAGAITATFVAAGYSPEEMVAAVNERQSDGVTPVFSSFMDVPAAEFFDDDVRKNSELRMALQKIDIPLVPNAFESKVEDALVDQLLKVSPHFCQIFSFVESGGLFAGNAFCIWLTKKLQDKNLTSGCTLADLAKEKNCDLSLIATDTTNREMLVLNHRTAPDLPVVIAVRMSMSIPFVWREVEWDANWGTYLGREKTGAKIVDGGVLSNFAIDLVATDNPRAKLYMGQNANPEEALNLGLLIDEAVPVPGVEGNPKRSARLATTRRIQRLVDTMTGARDNALIREYEAEICRLPAKGYGTTEFDMENAKLQALIEAGRQSMRAHLQKRGLLTMTRGDGQ